MDSASMRSILLDTVDSTNEQAKRGIRSGEITEPCYILARQQTAGKGSRGRSWSSPRDAGIYLSVVDFYPDDARIDVTNLTRAAAVAGVESLRTDALAVTIKPPNDLMVRGGKLGGILVETVVRPDLPLALVTGIGINVQNTPREVDHRDSPITSMEEILCAEDFSALDLDQLVARLVFEIFRQSREVFNGDADRVCSVWNANLA